MSPAFSALRRLCGCAQLLQDELCEWREAALDTARGSGSALHSRAFADNRNTSRHVWLENELVAGLKCNN